MAARSTKVWRIAQGLTAGNNFDGSAPARNGSEVEPNGEGESVWRYPNLDAGGEFDWPHDAYPREVRRIFLDLGDASSWKVDLVTTDAEENEVIHQILSESDFGGSTSIDVHGRALFVMGHDDVLRLTTNGATEELFASILVAPW